MTSWCLKSWNLEFSDQYRISIPGNSLDGASYTPFSLGRGIIRSPVSQNPSVNECSRKHGGSRIPS